MMNWHHELGQMWTETAWVKHSIVWDSQFIYYRTSHTLSFWKAFIQLLKSLWRMSILALCSASFHMAFVVSLGITYLSSPLWHVLNHPAVIFLIIALQTSFMTARTLCSRSDVLLITWPHAETSASTYTWCSQPQRYLYISCFPS